MSLTQLVLDGALAVLSLVRPGGNRISFENRDAKAALNQAAEAVDAGLSFPKMIVEGR